MFRSTSHALSWAFRINSTLIIKTATLSDSPPATNSTELTQHEKHTQAAYILRQLNMIEGMDKEYLYAQYGHVLGLTTMPKLVIHVTGVIGYGTRGTKCAHKLIQSYFGVHIPHRTIRALIGCNNNRVSEIRGNTYKALDSIGSRAYTLIDARLRNNNIVG